MQELSNNATIGGIKSESKVLMVSPGTGSVQITINDGEADKICCQIDSSSLSAGEDVKLLELLYRTNLVYKVVINGNAKAYINQT